MENVNASNLSNIIKFTDIDEGGHNSTVPNSPDEQRTTPDISVATKKLHESDNCSPLPDPPKENYSAIIVDEEPDLFAFPRSITQDEESFGGERDESEYIQLFRIDKGKARAVDPSDVV